MAQDAPALVLIDADRPRRDRLAALVRALGHACRAVASSPASGPSQVSSGLVLCVAEPTPALVRALRERFAGARIVIGSPDGGQPAAVRAFRAGADDFVHLGAGDAELAALLADATPAPPLPDAGDLVGDSAAMQGLRSLLPKLAASDATVLVTGETGTGKERAALLLHRLSRRAGQPLVALNCAAIPEALLEGELFGYERGAFSGAVAAYPGKLKLADHGTLLLDEIGELSQAGQAKVLRALETREVYRLGARTPTRFDVRIIAATNRDLEAEMQAGRFRADLFYRLAVARVHLPPLRDAPRGRRGNRGRAHCRQPAAPTARTVGTDAAARGAFRAGRHAWPGNVRELRNVLEVALLHGDGQHIRAADLPARLAGPGRRSRAPSPRWRPPRWKLSASSCAPRWPRLPATRRLPRRR